MKKILTILFLAAVALPASSQITLTQSNFPNPQDSASFVEVTSALTLPSGWANQTWNYDAVSFSGGTSYSDPYIADQNDPFFTTAQFSSPGYFKDIATIFGQSFGYLYTAYFATSATSSAEVGMEAPEQHYGIGTLTGNANDSLIILDSKNYYPSTPRTVMPLPATYGTAWSSVVRHVVNMTLTDSAAGLSAAPLTHVWYTYRADSIIGWGQLNVPSGSGTSGNLSVLIDREAQYTADSFYLYGSPAPAQLLTAFSLTQGGSSGPSAYKDYFYRAGSWTAALQIVYTDNTYSGQEGSLFNKNLPEASNGINEVAGNARSSAYPNPFDGQEFNVILDSKETIVAVSVMDVSGRVVANVNPVCNGSSLHVQMAAPLASGIYTYTVLNASGEAISTGKLVSVK